MQQVLQVAVGAAGYVLVSVLLSRLIVRRWRRQREEESLFTRWLDADSKKIRQQEPPQ